MDMDERELRTAMNQAVAVAPPPMSDEPVLAAGRRALTRRRAVWASTGSAAVVALMAVGVVVLAPSQNDGDGGEVRVGTQSPSQKTVQSSVPTVVTVTAGPEYDRGVALAAALDELAPAGYGTPDDLTGVGDFADRPLKTHKVMSLGTVGGAEVLNYAAGTPLSLGDRLGELVVTAYSPNGESAGEGCALTPVAWDSEAATCVDVVVGGKKVAVADVVYPPEYGIQPGQWAGYRHPDGTVVFVEQLAKMPRSGRPALPGMPMTAEQLAAMAADPRLKPQ
jgi:hypothetical protein